MFDLKHLGVTAVAFTLVAIGPWQEPQGARDAVFKSSSATVAVYATVRDRSTNRLAQGLRQEEFDVIDAGRRATISVFSSVPQALAVVTMIDLSSSVWDKLPTLRAAAHEFVDLFRPGDRAKIGSFSSLRIAISPTWTNDKVELHRILNEELWIGPNSPVWNATDRAIDSFEGATDRKVVLLLSDGRNHGGINGLKGSLGSVRQRAEVQGIMIYVIGPNLDASASELAKVTGGGSFELGPDLRQLSETLTVVADELHNQYLIGFEPVEPDGKTHAVTVSTKNPNLQVTARQSYVAHRR